MKELLKEVRLLKIMQSVDDAWDNFINNKEEPSINDEIEKLENNPKSSFRESFPAISI